MMMKLLLLWLGLWATLWNAPSTVVVSILDIHRRPVESPLTVTLHLYRIGQDGSAVPAWDGQCITSRGVCSITVPDDAPRDAAGFLHGFLTVEGIDGRRSVLWPGGRLAIGLLVTNGRIRVPHDRPYGHQTPSNPITKRQRFGVAYFVLAFLPLLLGVYLWYRQRR